MNCLSRRAYIYEAPFTKNRAFLFEKHNSNSITAIQNKKTFYLNENSLPSFTLGVFYIEQKTKKSRRI